jgi:hypothetical protein
MARCASFDFTMRMLAHAFTFNLDDADLCFKEIEVGPLLESVA